MQAMQVIECIRARQGDRLMSSVLMESPPGTCDDVLTSDGLICRGRYGTYAC
jgi:hypothetical protein